MTEVRALQPKPAGPGGCTSLSKRSQQLCRGPALRGTDKCPSHGGKAIERAKAEGQVRLEAMKWGLGDSTVDPGEVLLRLVTQSAARAEKYAAVMGQLVAEHDGDLRKALTANTYTVGEDGSATKTGEYVRAMARLEADERDRCATFATKAVAAGLAERQVRLAERQGAMLAQVIKAILDDLGLTAAQQALVGEVVPRHLRSVA